MSLNQFISISDTTIIESGNLFCSFSNYLFDLTYAIADAQSRRNKFILIDQKQHKEIIAVIDEKETLKAIDEKFTSYFPITLLYRSELIKSAKFVILEASYGLYRNTNREKVANVIREFKHYQNKFNDNDSDNYVDVHIPPGQEFNALFKRDCCVGFHKNLYITLRLDHYSDLDNSFHSGPNIYLEFFEWQKIKHVVKVEDVLGILFQSSYTLSSIHSYPVQNFHFKWFNDVLSCFKFNDGLYDERSGELFNILKKSNEMTEIKVKYIIVYLQSHKFHNRLIQQYKNMILLSHVFNQYQVIESENFKRSKESNSNHSYHFKYLFISDKSDDEKAVKSVSSSIFDSQLQTMFFKCKVLNLTFDLGFVPSIKSASNLILTDLFKSDCISFIGYCNEILFSQYGQVQVSYNCSFSYLMMKQLYLNADHYFCSTSSSSSISLSQTFQVMTSHIKKWTLFRQSKCSFFTSNMLYNVVPSIFDGPSNLSSPASSSFNLVVQFRKSEAKVLCIYALYVGRSYSSRQVNLENFYFFLEQEELQSKDIEFVIIHQIDHEFEDSIFIPEIYRPYVSIIRRLNGGYDFGAWGSAIFQVPIRQFDYFIFVNTSVRGPFIPRWIGKYRRPWYDYLIQFITKDGVNVSNQNRKIVKLVGLTTNYDPIPHLQSMLWATDTIGLQLMIKNQILVPDLRNVSFHHVIQHFEIQMSRIFIENGFDFYSFEMAESLYDSPNGNQQHKKINDNKPHLNIHEPHLYFNSTLNPCEILFIKTNKINDSLVKLYTSSIRHLTLNRLVQTHSIGYYDDDVDLKNIGSDITEDDLLNVVLRGDDSSKNSIISLFAFLQLNSSEQWVTQSRFNSSWIHPYYTKLNLLLDSAVYIYLWKNQNAWINYTYIMILKNQLFDIQYYINCKSLIEKSENADIIWYAHHSPLNLVEQGQSCHPKFKAIWMRLTDILNTTLKISSPENHLKFYPNGWIIKSSVLEKYLKFFRFVLYILDKDALLNKWLNEDSLYVHEYTQSQCTKIFKKNYIPHTPFILERLPSLFAHICKCQTFTWLN